jgi:hypothetical protein
MCHVEHSEFCMKPSKKMPKPMRTNMDAPAKPHAKECYEKLRGTVKK